ncbi:hypothetical protein [Streptomyces indicus]|uniref:hypothetical protein n=1 Tax=Streptomyces indicus TaxID=417292 RepID=UPI001FE48238|nr:hypothetical protein [Streptomyces indicus]
MDEPLFWLGHLTSCADSEEAAELLYGADYDATDEFGRQLWERAEWPAFTVPLAGDHRLHVKSQNPYRSRPSSSRSCVSTR